MRVLVIEDDPNTASLVALYLERDGFQPLVHPQSSNRIWVQYQYGTQLPASPFGHAGQDALNACMQTWGGFEHNLQSLRVVDELEEKYAGFPGLNLTFETREGILKHCSAANARSRKS